MSEPRPESLEEIEEQMRLDILGREALVVLRLIVDEWESDPQSVAGFDLRIVRRATEICKGTAPSGDQEQPR